MPDAKKPSSSAIDVELVQTVAHLLTEANVSEIEIEKGDLRIRVSRAAPPATVIHASPAMPMAPSLPSLGQMPAPAAIAAAAAGAAAGDPAKHPGAVKSPMVGTAYLAPQPGAAPYVKPGDTVTEGQTVLIIEAMKTMNAIPAPRAGRVAQVLIQDAEPVEFGQVLLILE
jgi:acetyl-CoA carboxylase biotin carboxyl carrier protein